MNELKTYGSGKYLKVSNHKIQFYLLLTIKPPFLRKKRIFVTFFHKTDQGLPAIAVDTLIRTSEPLSRLPPEHLYQVLEIADQGEF
ncbi:hypothetical protein [Coleofasciculus sp.]|uniref:hypothetical protein n=1 Tax=Coleofasciculus sp. TaxID=3100458 RepID=UPI0039FAAF5F